MPFMTQFSYTASLLPYSTHQNGITKLGAHSRGSEFDSTSWREGCQRICGHILKSPHPHISVYSYISLWTYGFYLFLWVLNPSRPLFILMLKLTQIGQCQLLSEGFGGLTPCPQYSLSISLFSGTRCSRLNFYFSYPCPGSFQWRTEILKPKSGCCSTF